MQLADVFPLGKYLQDELEARGWTQAQFARIIGRPLQVVNQIIKGKKRITAPTAAAIAAAFGASAELWMNLESAWPLSHVKADPQIAKRAKQMAVSSK